MLSVLSNCRAVVLALCAATLLPACNLTGPTALRDAPVAYNEAIATTRDQQHLLNLVRLKYRDVPLFLEVGSLSTQYQFNTGISGSTSFTDGSGESSPSFGIGGNAGWAEKPTITYTPLQGERFVTQMMAPIPLEVLALLSRSGWSFERVARLAAQSMNGVPNAPTASGPTPSRQPAYEEFRQAVRLVRELQRSGDAQVSLAPSDAGLRLGLRLCTDRSEADEVRRLLRLDAGVDMYGIVAGYDDRDVVNGAQIELTPRSFLGILFYLSHAVEVPAEHAERGLVTRTTTADGAPFDWTDVTGDLLRVHTSSSRPDNAYIAVPYRGEWFYIDDSDLESKSTFALLSYLFALQAGDRKSITPALTLPL